MIDLLSLLAGQIFAVAAAIIIIEIWVAWRKHTGHPVKWQWNRKTELPKALTKPRKKEENQ